jgi:hypothetical protein
MSDKDQKKAERLPEGTVHLDDKGGFTITLQKLKQDKLHDQASVSKEGIGCYNNPGGPTC